MADPVFVQPAAAPAPAPAPADVSFEDAIGALEQHMVNAAATYDEIKRASSALVAQLAPIAGTQNDTVLTAAVSAIPAGVTASVSGLSPAVDELAAQAVGGSRLGGWVVGILVAASLSVAGAMIAHGFGLPLPPAANAILSIVGVK